jgi:hypothetical protein
MLVVLQMEMGQIPLTLILIPLLSCVWLGWEKERNVHLRILDGVDGGMEGMISTNNYDGSTISMMTLLSYY